jgi:atrial natriuretic peptide receptor A
MITKFDDSIVVRVCLFYIFIHSTIQSNIEENILNMNVKPVKNNNVNFGNYANQYPLYNYKKRQLMNDKIIPINILLLLPENGTYKFSMRKVRPALDLAISEIKVTDYGRKFDIILWEGECDCSGITAPINAMKYIYANTNSTNYFQAIFGPICDYSLAPIARYAPFWNVSVLTVGAMAQEFRNNKLRDYRTLTNIGPTLFWLDKFVYKLFDHFEWKQTIFLFDKDYQDKTSNFNCYLTMASLKATLLRAKITVDYKIKDTIDVSYERMLIDYVGNKFSVVILCGSTDFVRDILLAALKLGFINGEYTFISFDLYAQIKSNETSIKPWENHRSDQLTIQKRHQELADIKLAYEALLIITLKIDDFHGEYRNFQKKLTNSRTNLFANEDEVNILIHN